MDNEVLFHDNDDRLHREKILFYQKNAGFTAAYKGCKTLLNKQYFTISISRFGIFVMECPIYKCTFLTNKGTLQLSIPNFCSESIYSISIDFSQRRITCTITISNFYLKIASLCRCDAEDLLFEYLLRFKCTDCCPIELI